MKKGELNRKIAQGVGWMVFLKLAERMIGIASTIILARLLLPSDFGLIAMAMSVVALVELVRALGFETALIQNQSAERKDYDTAWTLNIVFSLLVGVTLVLLSGVAQEYYNDTRLGPVLLVIAASQVALGFQNIGTVAFRRDLTFDKEFRFTFARRIFAFVVTVVLAVVIRNYWALLVGIVSGNLFLVVYSYIVHPYRPRLCLKSTRSLMGFSKWLLANQVLNVAITRSLHFILGRFSTSRAVGLFTVSYEVATLPTTTLISPINRALFPGYAKMSDDLAVLREATLSVLGLIYFCAIPAGIGISIVAEYLVPVLLGDRWADAIPLIEILAVSGTLVAARANFGTALIAIGKPKFITAVSLVHALLLVPTLFFAVREFGAVGAAFTYLAIEGMLLAVRYAVLLKILRISITSLVRGLWRPVLSSSTMVLIVEFGLKRSVLEPAAITGIVALVATVAVGVVCYASIAVLLWRAAGSPVGAERQVMTLIRSGLSRFKGPETALR